MQHQIMQLLVCPQARESLKMADHDLLALVNQAIGQGQVTNCAGARVVSSVSAGLVRTDGAVLYPVINGIPILLMHEAIMLEQWPNRKCCHEDFKKPET